MGTVHHSWEDMAADIVKQLDILCSYSESRRTGNNLKDYALPSPPNSPSITHFLHSGFSCWGLHNLPNRDQMGTEFSNTWVVGDFLHSNYNKDLT